MIRTRGQAPPGVMVQKQQIPGRRHYRRRRLRQSISLVLALAITYYYYRLFLASKTSPAPPPKPGHSQQHQQQSSPGGGRPHHPPEQLLNNLSLTAAECDAAFPGLTWPVHDVVSQGPFTLRHPATSPGVIGRISLSSSAPGQVPRYALSILRAQRKNDLSQEMLNSRAASLHQIHRALLTAPYPDNDASSSSSDDIIFALNFQDQPFGTSWAYSRQADPHARPGPADGDADARTFLMPHFSFWAWKLPFVGSMWRAAAAITITTSTPFASKIPKAVWRGTTWFNSVHNPRLRANLLAATKNKPWADVEALRWDTTAASSSDERTASNALPIEDFCRYKYVLHTEGVTYSGRFQFLQMCESVVLTPPIGWMQHTTHLVKPLFSYSLFDKNDNEDEGNKEKPTWTPSEATRRAWPTNYGPESEEANLVFVAPDWGDLEETVAWLEAHPEVAAGIARRQRETFVGGGYFSPAAETCYWRALIRGWGQVVRVDEGDLAELGTGQTFETFALSNGD